MRFAPRGLHQGNRATAFSASRFAASAQGTAGSPFWRCKMKKLLPLRTKSLLHKIASSPSPASTYNYAPAPDAVLARARAIWAVCGELGAAPQAAALHFPLTHRAVASVVVGARSAREVAEIAAWRDGRLPPRLFEDLQSQGFIAEGAPIDGRGAPCA